MLIKVNCKDQKFDKTFKSNKKHQQLDFADPQTKKNPQPLTFPLTFETGKNLQTTWCTTNRWDRPEPPRWTNAVRTFATS